MNNPNLSEPISSFLRTLEQASRDFEWSRQEETRLDQLTQDYLHLLELEETNYHDRARIAAALRQCRIDRRTAKESAELLEPVVEFLKSDRGKAAVSQLQQVLGTVRKAQKTIEGRLYMPRVLTLEEYQRKCNHV